MAACGIARYCATRRIAMAGCALAGGWTCRCDPREVRGAGGESSRHEQEGRVGRDATGVSRRASLFGAIAAALCRNAGQECLRAFSRRDEVAFRHTCRHPRRIWRLNRATPPIGVILRVPTSAMPIARARTARHAARRVAMACSQYCFRGRVPLKAPSAWPCAGGRRGAGRRGAER